MELTLSPVGGGGQLETGEHRRSLDEPPHGGRVAASESP